MKNLLLLVIVLAGVAFLGKVVIENRYESKLDEAISITRAFVDIDYDGIKIDFDGSISINNLSITPRDSDESVRVAQIRAISSDRMMPIKGLSIFENGKFPETFELDFKQLSAPTEVSGGWQKAYLGDWSTKEECRSLDRSFNYSSAGYSRYDGDMRIAFDFSDLYNAVVNIESFDQVGAMTFEWVFDANNIESVVRRQTSNLPVNEVSATFELEPDAAQRFVGHCANVFKVTPDVFLEKVVGSAKYSQNSFGADLGPDMRQALVKFLKGGSRFNVYSKPSSQLKKMEQLQFYKAKDVLRWLNMTLSIDGEQLPLDAAVLAAEESVLQSSEETSEAAQQPVTWLSRSADSAEEYIGRIVRVKRTNQRNELRGRLTGIDQDDRLKVEIGRHGGVMTLTVGIDEIAEFEVMNK